jgi:ribose 5-phosphate isomerase RpiB
MIEKFVKTEFSNEERHIRRIEKIGMLEQWN